MTTRPAKPTVRYSAIKSARTVGSANVELHHHGGRDPLDKAEPVNVLAGIVEVPVGRPVGGQQTDVLIVADRLGRQARLPGG